MARRSHLKAVQAAPPLTQTAEQILARVLDRLETPGEGRAFPFYRIRELCPPLSKSTVLRMIQRGELRAVRFKGMTLIEAASVDELRAKLKPWRPPKRKDES